MRGVKMKIPRKISDLFGAMSAVLMAAIWVLMTAEVIARNIFESPILGASEIAIYLYVSAAYFGFSYTQKHKGHIVVELLYDRFGEKAKRINEFIVYLISDVLFICFSICMWNAFVASFKIREIYLSAMKMPVYVLRFAIALGLTAMVIQLLIDTYDSFIGILHNNGTKEVQK
jgi:TRAP-type C4-dicarboxylate transport system permease small subunit